MIKQLFKYARGERWKIIVYYIFHIISIFGLLCQPSAFAMIVNALQKQEDDMIKNVLFWLGIYVLGFIVFNLFHRSARFMERYVAFRAKKRFIIDIYNFMESLPLSWHEENHTGNVMDRVNKAADSIFYFGQSQASIIEMAINFIGASTILFIISPVIAVVALIAGVVQVMITKKLYKIVVPEYTLQNEGFHNVSAALFDYIRNITTIIVLKLGKYVCKDINNRIDNVFPHMAKENKVTQIKCLINDLLVVCLNVCLIFYYIYSRNTAGKVVMVGSITAIFQYLGVFMSAIDYYASGYEDIIHWSTSFKAVKPILSAVPVKKNTQIEPVSKWRKVEIGPINYSYGEGKAQLNDVSLCLYKGKKIAFIGESGAGKSTMLKILCGLIRVDNDKVWIDGKDGYIDSLENAIAYIPQEPEVFENTISYNITMGVQASQDEIEKCAKMACFHDVVTRLEKGYESDIRENGVNLSGGEKQRLALTRGLFAVRDNSIVLLDEPTGSLDPSTEMQVYKQVFDEMSDKCIVSVLHRLHLLSLFDYIYVFKRGSIVEEGTFKDLLESDGEFKKLWNEYQVEQNGENDNLQ